MSVDREALKYLIAVGVLLSFRLTVLYLSPRPFLAFVVPFFVIWFVLDQLEQCSR